MYLAAVAEKCGWKAQIIDMQNLKEPLPEADVYAVTSTSPQWPTTLKLSERLAKEHPESLSIVGGNHISAVPKEAKATKFNACIIGEGEQILQEILQEPQKWKQKQQEIVRAKPLENLDEVPFPARHLIDWSQYKRGIFWGKKLLAPAVSIIQSRGCPFSCIFCGSHTIFSHRTRYRSIENVIAEVKQIKSLGFNGLNFNDDTFCLDRERTVQLCRELEKLHVVWRCLSRVNTVDEEILQVMAEAGCVEIIYGIESGNQQILNKLRKGVTVEQNLHAMKITKKAGIQVKAGIIVGSPGETWETVHDTEKLLKQCPPDYWNVSVFTPYPGSYAFEHPEKLGLKILTHNLDRFAMVGPTLRGNVVVETEQMRKQDIEQARDELIDLLLNISGEGA